MKLFGKKDPTVSRRLNDTTQTAVHEITLQLGKDISAFRRWTIERLAYAKVVESKQQNNNLRSGGGLSEGVPYDLRNTYRNWMEAYWQPNAVMRQSQFTGYHLFKDMNADAVVRKSIGKVKDALLAKPFFIRSARPGDEVEDTKAALAAWQMEQRILKFPQKQRKILGAYDYGYTPTEKIFRYEDVTIPPKQVQQKGVVKQTDEIKLKSAFVIADLHTRPPAAFSFDGLGDMWMVPGTKDGQPGYATPRRLSAEEETHFMVFTHEPSFEGDRYGDPMKATMFWPWLTKKAIKIYRMIYAEKYGGPVLKGEYPPNAKKDQIDDFELRLKGFQKNSWIMSPAGFALQLVEAANKSGSIDVFQNILDYCDGDIRETATGLREDSKDGTMDQDKLEHLGKDWDSLWNDEFIVPLIDANFKPNGYYPFVQTITRPEADLDKEVFRMSTLHNINVPLSLGDIYETTGRLRPLTDDDKLLGAADLQAKAADRVGGNNSKNTEISDQTRKTQGEQEDPMTQGGGHGQEGEPGRNIG